jgi:hypothetical protein
MACPLGNLKYLMMKYSELRKIKLMCTGEGEARRSSENSAFAQSKSVILKKLKFSA